jgi:hypothetical protein
MKNIAYLLLLFISCQPEIEIEFYEDSGNVKIEKIYSSKDTDKYEIRYYYHNGQLQTKGMIINSLEEGFWDYYSIDGLKEASIPYIRGKIDYMNPKRPEPYVVIYDSLKINVPCKYRIFNLFPGESLNISNNAFMTPRNHNQDLFDAIFSILDTGHFTTAGNENDFSFTAYVTPLYGEEVVFYYAKKMEKIKIASSCINDLQSRLSFLTKEEIETGEFYKMADIPIHSFPIYK